MLHILANGLHLHTIADGTATYTGISTSCHTWAAFHPGPLAGISAAEEIARLAIQHGMAGTVQYFGSSYFLFVPPSVLTGSLPEPVQL